MALSYFKEVTVNIPRERAFELMERNSISQVLVTREGAYVGIVHLHDILKEGIF